MVENNEEVKMGTILKDKRVALGCTREQVAERSGISARYLIAIENEEKIPRIPVLKRILQSIGLSADAVLFPENTEKGPESIRLLRLLETCDPRDQKVIAAMIDAMIDSRNMDDSERISGPDKADTQDQSNA